MQELLDHILIERIKKVEKQVLCRQPIFYCVRMMKNDWRPYSFGALTAGDIFQSGAMHGRR